MSVCVCVCSLLLTKTAALLQAAYEKSAELREARREKLLEYTRRQGKAYTLTATIAAKMQRVKMIEKEDAAAAEEADEFAHLGVFCMYSRSLLPI